MKRIYLILSIALMLISCTKESLLPDEGGKSQPPAGMGELALGTVLIGEGESQVGPTLRAAQNIPLPQDATLRLYAFKEGVTDFNAVLATRTYTIDSNGRPQLDVGQDPLYLPIGKMDIYLAGPVEANVGTISTPLNVEIALSNGIYPHQGADLIAGYASATIKAGTENLLPSMTLTHKMARVQVVVSEHDQAAYENLKVTEMKLYAQPTTGSYTLDATGGTVIADNNPADITFAQVTEEEAKKRYSITTLLLPQAERELKIETTFECNQKNVDAGDSHPTLRYRQSGLVTSALAAGSATQFTTAPLTPVEIKWRTKVLPWDDVMGEDIVIPGPFRGIDYTTQPANSYYCSTADAGVMFDASKKPRTKAEIMATDVLNLYNTDVKPAKVEILWQTAKDHGTTGGADNMVIKSIDYNLSIGLCIVNTNGGAGNAYLVGKDADNNIIWGWHIWVTDGVIRSGNLVNGVKFMDRNMGALGATATKPTEADAYKYFGLLWQWGRKEPITGQGVGTTANTYTKIFNAQGIEIPAGSFGGFTLNTGGASSMDDCVRNPMTFYVAVNNGMISDNPSTWSDTGKSIYDPCPYGYRVPKNGSFNGTTGSRWTTGAVDGGTAWNGTWWPAAGERQRNPVLFNIGSWGLYFSSSISTNTKAYNLAFGDNNSVYTNGNSNRSHSLSVRCVVE